MACVYEKLKAIAKPCGQNVFGVASVELVEEAGIFYMPRGIRGTSTVAPTLSAGYDWQVWQGDKNETLVRESNEGDANHGTFFSVEIVMRMAKDRAEILAERIKTADYRLAAKVRDKNGVVKLYRNLLASFENNTGAQGSPNAYTVRLTAANKEAAKILM